jgi:hypothetical protein
MQSAQNGDGARAHKGKVAPLLSEDKLNVSEGSALGSNMHSDTASTKSHVTFRGVAHTLRVKQQLYYFNSEPYTCIVGPSREFSQPDRYGVIFISNYLI